MGKSNKKMEIWIKRVELSVKKMLSGFSKNATLMLPVSLVLPLAFIMLLVPSAHAEEKVYKVNIEGMHCKTCIYRVTKSLKMLPQTKEVKVNLKKGFAIIKLKDNEDVTRELLEEAVTDSGYKLSGVEEIGD